MNDFLYLTANLGNFKRNISNFNLASEEIISVDYFDSELEKELHSTNSRQSSPDNHVSLQGLEPVSLLHPMRLSKLSQFTHALCEIFEA